MSLPSISELNLVSWPSPSQSSAVDVDVVVLSALDHDHAVLKLGHGSPQPALQRRLARLRRRRLRRLKMCCHAVSSASRVLVAPEGPLHQVLELVVPDVGEAGFVAGGREVGVADRRRRVLVGVPVDPAEPAQDAGLQRLVHAVVGQHLVQQFAVGVHRDLGEASFEGGIDLVDATVERVHRGQDDEVRRDLDLVAVGDGERQLALGALDVGQRLAEDAADVGAR